MSKGKAEVQLRNLHITYGINLHHSGVCQGGPPSLQTRSAEELWGASPLVCLNLRTWEEIWGVRKNLLMLRMRRVAEESDFFRKPWQTWRP